MIKHTLLSLFAAGILLFVVSCKSGSNDKEVIRKTVEEMNQHVMKEEFEQVVGYMHPESFQTFTSAEMASGFKEFMHTDTYDMKVKEFVVDSVSEIYKNDTSKFAVVSHHAVASFNYKIPPSADKPVQESMMNTYCTNMKMGLGEKYVTCHNAEKRIDVMMPDRTYFIYSPGREKWFAITKINETALEKLIPADIRAKLDQ
jgi:hypothetical protein